MTSLTKPMIRSDGAMNNADMYLYRELERDFQKLLTDCYTTQNINPLDEVKAHTKISLDWNKKMQQAIEACGFASA